jgi:hypothetical protein
MLLHVDAIPASPRVGVDALDGPASAVVASAPTSPTSATICALSSGVRIVGIRRALEHLVRSDHHPADPGRQATALTDPNIISGQLTVTTSGKVFAGTPPSLAAPSA